MELDDVLRTTFSARDFTSDPLPDATLYRILDRARFAPSGGNRQGWRVVVVRDRATREALAAVMPLGRPVKPLTKLKRKAVHEFAMLERWGGAPLAAGR